MNPVIPGEAARHPWTHTKKTVANNPFKICFVVFWFFGFPNIIMWLTTSFECVLCRSQKLINNPIHKKEILIKSHTRLERNVKQSRHRSKKKSSINTQEKLNLFPQSVDKKKTTIQYTDQREILIINPYTKNHCFSPQSVEKRKKSTIQTRISNSLPQPSFRILL